MELSDLIPQSVSDSGAILFWVILFILIVVVVAFYYYAKRMKKKVTNIKQEMTTQLDTVKKSKEKTMQDLSEVKNKVDKILKEDQKQ